jgi:hypothetical protein
MSSLLSLLLSLQQNWRTRGRTGSAQKQRGWSGPNNVYTINKYKNDKIKERKINK